MHARLDASLLQLRPRRVAIAQPHGIDVVDMAAAGRFDRYDDIGAGKGVRVIGGTSTTGGTGATQALLYMQPITLRTIAGM